MSLLISLQSESIKIKRSAAFYLCFIVAAIVPTILFFDLVTPDDGEAIVQKMELSKYFRMGQQVFNFIFLPLFIILISTLLLQIEYKNNTWKQVLTSPQKISNVFLSKFITLHIIIITFIASFLLLILSVAFIIDIIHPTLFKKGYSLQNVLIANWKAYVAIFGISAIQFWLALRFKNFIAPLAIGFCLWIMAPLMLFSFHWSFADRYPYSFSILLSEMSEMPAKPNVPLLVALSVLYGLFFLLVAFIEFKVRKVKS